VDPLQPDYPALEVRIGPPFDQSAEHMLQASKAADWLLGYVPADGVELCAKPSIDRRAA
jgi:hypothetical protein